MREKLTGPCFVRWWWHLSPPEAVASLRSSTRVLTQLLVRVLGISSQDVPRLARYLLTSGGGGQDWAKSGPRVS